MNDEHPICPACGSAPEDHTRCIECGNPDDLATGRVEKIPINQLQAINGKPFALVYSLPLEVNVDDPDTEKAIKDDVADLSGSLGVPVVILSHGAELVGIGAYSGTLTIGDASVMVSFPTIEELNLWFRANNLVPAEAPIDVWAGTIDFPPADIQEVKRAGVNLVQHVKGQPQGVWTCTMTQAVHAEVTTNRDWILKESEWDCTTSTDQHTPRT